MTFWIPVILKPDGILIVVVPLNTLGNQNIEQLTRVGISVRNPPGVFLSGNSGHVHVPGEVPPGTLRERSHAPGPLGSRPPPANS